MKKTTTLAVIIVLLSLAPCIYLAAIWTSIPSTVPLHFGSNLQPDRVGDKSEMIIPVAAFVIASLGVYFLLTNLHRIDPKRQNKDSTRYAKLAIGLSVFMAIINFLIILSSAKGAIVLEHVLFPLMGLLFAFIGNYMHNIKPNYFAGLRLPWTLSDDENWRKTHLLAGKLWFWCGLIFAVVAVFLPVNVSLYVFLPMIAIITIIPSVYSYRLFRDKKRMTV
ncbi:MAG: hypothetical protein JWN76_243 [Chitinophagaceae bacterium]|nr:hypothetical protein [Chitinophagaceae bacterium]